VIQILTGIATHSTALLLYPGLLTMVVFGALVEAAWIRLSTRELQGLELPRRRPTPVLGTIALSAVVAAVQLAAPFNLVPGDERSVVLAVVALSFTAWAELALTVEFAPAPGLLLVIQLCWLLAVLGPAVHLESLRPQVLGNALLTAVLPVKVACAFLYLLCLPALLRLWPLGPAGERRGKPRIDRRRILTWFAYCGLFTTLFLPPSADDPAGLLRFFGATSLVAALVVVAGIVVQRRGPDVVRGTYTRVVPPFAALVLAIVVLTSVFVR
jgi:hypothetical protein